MSTKRLLMMFAAGAAGWLASNDPIALAQAAPPPPPLPTPAPITRHPARPATANAAAAPANAAQPATTNTARPTNTIYLGDLLKKAERPAPPPPKPAFAMQNGDRVVFLGDDLLDRERRYGFLEFTMATHFPRANITFRNLARESETIGVDTEKVIERLRPALDAIKPSVACIAYGMSDALTGKVTADQYVAGVGQLMDAVESVSGKGKVKFILFTSCRHEARGEAPPEVQAHNESLTQYNTALKKLAADRAAELIGIFELMISGRGDREAAIILNYESDGIHLIESGYLRASMILESNLRWQRGQWWLGIYPDGSQRSGSFGFSLAGMVRREDYCRFAKTDTQVFAHRLDLDTNMPPRFGSCRLQIQNLTPGNYVLRIDDVPHLNLTAQDAQRGLWIDRGPQFEQADQIRKTVIHKNDLVRRRWADPRPDDPARLDEEIAAAERQIHEFKAPKTHVYEIASALVPLDEAPLKPYATFTVSGPPPVPPPPPVPSVNVATPPAQTPATPARVR